MQTPYQQMLLKDIGSADGYGVPLAGWKLQQQFFIGPTASVPLGPPLTALSIDLAMTFVEGVYFLLKTTREIAVYRGFETKGLTAPYGKDHPAYGLVPFRKPGTPDGLWWTPGRPSLEIDNLGLSSMHRAEPRDSAGIKLEWNRLDYYLEGVLPMGSLVYVGRAAPQQESAAYGRRKYSGGGYQFRLTGPPTQVLRSMKQYRAI
jgi:hypothetical protein